MKSVGETRLDNICPHNLALTMRPMRLPTFEAELGINIHSPTMFVTPSHVPITDTVPHRYPLQLTKPVGRTSPKELEAMLVEVSTSLILLLLKLTGVLKHPVS